MRLHLSPFPRLRLPCPRSRWQRLRLRPRALVRARNSPAPARGRLRSSRRRPSVLLSRRPLRLRLPNPPWILREANQPAGALMRRTPPSSAHPLSISSQRRKIPAQAVAVACSSRWIFACVANARCQSLPGTPSATACAASANFPLRRPLPSARTCVRPGRSSKLGVDRGSRSAADLQRWALRDPHARGSLRGRHAGVRRGGQASCWPHGPWARTVPPLRFLANCLAATACSTGDGSTRATEPVLRLAVCAGLR